MRIWLIKIGEPLSTDGANQRLLRTGLLARLLAARGHDVVWWTSTFNHVRKTHRSPREVELPAPDGYRLRLLHGCAYRKNVSLARIRNHRQVARAFARGARREQPPHVIVCSMPTLELSAAAVRWGRAAGVPVVLDIRDLWPDIIVDHAPRWARPAARLVLQPMFRQLRVACRGATAILGITDGIVNWGLDYAGRQRGPLDRSFPLAYSAAEPDSADLARARAYWQGLGIDRREGQFTACFVGSANRRIDLENLVLAARRLRQRQPQCRIVVSGDGESLHRCKQLAADCPNVIFTGWIGKAEIWALLRLAHVGLVPYPNTRDFVLSIPNKAIEYLSAGLPILTSLDGTLRELIEKHECGVQYSNPGADLADQLELLARNPGSLEKMAKNAAALFQRQFVAEQVYADFCRYLEEEVVPSPDGTTFRPAVMARRSGAPRACKR